MRIEDLWFSTKPAAKLGRIALTPTSWLYALGWEVYAATYRFGLKKPQEPFCPVVCVGNLVVGGSGKTPTTLAAAKLLIERGEKVVLSLSGYGSPRSEAATVAPQGPLKAAEWGDEPAMIRWLMPGVPLIVGRRRVLAAQLASEHFGGHVLLMDDGFQHLPLRKHLTLLLDEENPTNKKCLPAGPYREPRRNRRKADLVLGEKFKLVRSPLSFLDPSRDSAVAPESAAMLCAIGNPDGFEKALKAAGISVVARRTRPDHDPLTAGNLFNGLNREVALVATAKDWVKLQVHPDLEGRPIYIALQDAEIAPKAEFGDWLCNQLASIRTT